MKNKDKYIKIHVPGESLWATDLGNNQAKIDNIPLTNLFGFGDIIEYKEVNKDSAYEFVRVVQQTSKTFHIKYDAEGYKYSDVFDEKTIIIRERYKEISQYLKKFNFFTEGIVAGMACVAVPIETTDKIFEAIIEASPVTITL